MARKLPRSITRKPATQIADDDPLLSQARARHGQSGASGGGEGGAWAQVGTAVMSSELQRLQSERLTRLLDGDLVIELDPAQIDDEVGSDRSNPWIGNPAFEALKASIATNGQDIPIQVVPGPGWSPVFNETDGIVLDGIRFRVISGRRRLEVARQLGRKVRAVCVRVAERAPTFDQLHRRFRENAARENLNLFDELLAIGEMFSHAKASGEKITGRSLARTLGVAEAKVSRGRAVFDHRERLTSEVDDPHALTLHQLDALIPALRAASPLPPVDGVTMTVPQPGDAPARRRPAPPPAFKRTHIIEGREVMARSRRGKITLDLGNEALIDEAFLDRLLLFIASERGG